MTPRHRALLLSSLPVLLVLLAAFSPARASAQERGIKLAIGDFGLGIGDVRRLDGVRLNFRDRDLERVRGLHATIWTPYAGAQGAVKGVALGLPSRAGATSRVWRSGRGSPWSAISPASPWPLSVWARERASAGSGWRASGWEQEAMRKVSW